jgi:hypothetical protein
MTWISCTIFLRLRSFSPFMGSSKYDIDLLACFHMDDRKPTQNPFLSRVKLEGKYSTPLVDTTLYHHLVESLINLNHTCPNFSFLIDIISCFMIETHEPH